MKKEIDVCAFCWSDYGKLFSHREELYHAKCWDQLLTLEREQAKKDTTSN